MTRIPWLIRLLPAAALIAAVLQPTWPAWAQGPATPAPPLRAITVTGQGEAEAAPDLARVTLGVEATGPTAKDAADRARTDMNQVFDALKAQGIADKDIRTSAYNIWSDQPPRPQNAPATAAEKPVYHVSNDVALTIRDLAKTGAVLDAAVAAGANSAYGVSFDLADHTAINSQAREAAVNDAHSKALELAKLTGVQLGDVISISEVAGVGGPQPMFKTMAAASANAPSPISPGELRVSLQLEIVYAIK
jgi:uncharacterized protein YggE